MRLFASFVLYSSLAISFVEAYKVAETFVPLGASCHDFTIPITITSENLQWTAPKWADN